jgi:hypothetical protein
MDPVYILDMLNIPNEVKLTFDYGEFAIHQKTGTRACRVNVHLINADYLRVNPTIPPFPIYSLIKKNSVAISLYMPLKVPVFWCIANSPE